MVQCPSCSHQIDQEFGMVTCQECQAVFMIDFSGNVEYSDGSTVLSEPIIDDEIPNENIESDDFSSGVQAVGENLLDDPPPFGEPGEEALVPGEELLDYESEEKELVHAEEGPAILESVAPSIEKVAIADPNPVDITEFANSEESLLEDGEYLYNLSIDRIDSKDLRDTVKYVLGDDKLKIDLTEVMGRLKNGKITINDLHPLKAKRIIEQLQYYDFDIRWEQRLVVLEDEVTEMDINVGN